MLFYQDHKITIDPALQSPSRPPCPLLFHSKSLVVNLERLASQNIPAPLGISEVGRATHALGGYIQYFSSLIHLIIQLASLGQFRPLRILSFVAFIIVKSLYRLFLFYILFIFFTSKSRTEVSFLIFTRVLSFPRF